MDRRLLVLLCLIVVLLSQIVQLGRVVSVTATSAPTLIPTFTSIFIPTPTPWVKQDIVVQMGLGWGLSVWVDDASNARYEVDKVEGVIDTELMHKGHMIYVRVDPRFNKILVAEAIVTRLR